MSQLAGKAVLVTGASSGIGWACAHAFCAEGAKLAVAARRTEKLAELAKELKAASPSVEVLEIQCDVGDRAQAERAVARTVERFGGIDVLVNNAGITDTAPFETQDPAKLEEILRTNFLGTTYTTRAALAPMRRRGAGHIVNVASIAGLMGMPYMAAYCASKFAMVGFTEALRRELYGSGITLTAFCPGTVDTPMVAEAVADPGLNKIIRPLTAEYIAQRIVRAVRRREPEVVVGEVPLPLIVLSRFFTRLTDWATHQVVRRVHPQARALWASGTPR